METSKKIKFTGKIKVLEKNYQNIKYEMKSESSFRKYKENIFI